jgi:hypothetical protein
VALDTEYLLAEQDYKAFFIHKNAVDAIAAMFALTHSVGAAYGVESTEYTRQLDSLLSCLTAIFGRAGFGRRMSIVLDTVLDGGLSLHCNEDDAFVFGMVFHRDRSKEGADVIPGTWSLHS